MTKFGKLAIGMVLLTTLAACDNNETVGEKLDEAGSAIADGGNDVIENVGDAFSDDSAIEELGEDIEQSVE